LASVRGGYLNSEERLQQTRKHALEPQRSIGHCEADAIFTRTRKWLMLGTFVGFCDVAAIQNGIAIAQTSLLLLDQTHDLLSWTKILDLPTALNNQILILCTSNSQLIVLCI